MVFKQAIEDDYLPEISVLAKPAEHNDVRPPSRPELSVLPRLLFPGCVETVGS